MKTVLSLLLVSILFCATSHKPLAPKGETPSAAKAALRRDTISFVLQIQPILKTHCNPCHFPGGKMYEKMPFDRPETIREHQAGVTRRISAAPDKKLFEQFFAQAGR